MSGARHATPSSRQSRQAQREGYVENGTCRGVVQAVARFSLIPQTMEGLTGGISSVRQTRLMA